jgi:hypothetical protein
MMKAFCVRGYISCVSLVCFSLASAQDVFNVRGRVLDAQTQKPLAAANIRLWGTMRGTITNANGQYVLSLFAGTHTIITSYVGYRTDTSVVPVARDVEYDILLEPITIQFPEILVGAEDPAFGIIRKAIARKQEWLGQIRSFEGRAYARTTLMQDTAISMISESYSTLYWARGDSLREVLTQKRQSANVPLGIPLAQVEEFVNFYEDRIHLGGFTFVGPIADDAFSFYNYRLRNIKHLDGVPVYEIDVIPRSQLTPLYGGRISISGDSYGMIDADLQPNEAFVIPVVTSADVRLRQQFRLYENRYWLPFDYHLQAQFGISILLTSVRVGLNKSVVVYDYSINPNPPEYVSRLPKFVVNPSAEKFDSTFWAQTNVLPLTAEEQRAYSRIDSVEKARKQQPPSAWLRFLGGIIPWAKHMNFRFNRVEGLFLGGSFSADSMLNWATVYGKAGYGFSERRMKYVFGTRINPLRSIHVGFELYDMLANTPAAMVYTPFETSIAALLRKEDYHDYYRITGSRWSLTVQPDVDTFYRSFQFSLAYRDETHKSSTVSTEFSLARRQRRFRENPPITEGVFRLISLDVETGNLFGSQQRRGFELSLRGEVEYSSQSFLQSGVDFTQYRMHVRGKIPTMYYGRLMKPYLAFMISGGLTTGTLVQQRILALESSLGEYAPFGVMQGIIPKEFSGSSFLAVTVEHNFRNVLFQSIGISTTFEAILYASAGRTWFSAIHAGVPLQARSTPGWYHEVGFGIGRLLQFFRMNFTWRLTPQQANVVTLGTIELF